LNQRIHYIVVRGEHNSLDAHDTRIT